VGWNRCSNLCGVLEVNAVLSLCELQAMWEPGGRRTHSGPMNFKPVRHPGALRAVTARSLETFLFAYFSYLLTSASTIIASTHHLDVHTEA
jgi:hypothetical protein